MNNNVQSEHIGYIQEYPPQGAISFWQFQMVK